VLEAKVRVPDVAKTAKKVNQLIEGDDPEDGSLFGFGQSVKKGGSSSDLFS
jgi:hypothetical protein